MTSPESRDALTGHGFTMLVVYLFSGLATFPRWPTVANSNNTRICFSTKQVTTTNDESGVGIVQTNPLPAIMGEIFLTGELPQHNHWRRNDAA